MNAIQLPPINNVSARDAVYQCLRRAILSGQFQPGERLVERELSSQLQTSHIPIREALRMLERDGLVQFTPFKGAQVIKLEPGDLDQFYHVRAVLEGFAARLGAIHITQKGVAELETLLEQAHTAAEEQNIPEVARINLEFHSLIAKCSQNAVLVDFLERIRNQIHFFMLQSLGTRNRPMQTREEHRLILVALAEHDPANAEQAAANHVLSALRVVKSST